MTPLRHPILKLKEQYHYRYKQLNPYSWISEHIPLIIAGEWIGPGIQKGVAISTFPSKLFVIVSAFINGIWLPDADYANIHDEEEGFYNISRGGFYHRSLDLNNMTASVAAPQELANAVEKECPFAKTFNVSGKGEGIVWKAAPPFPSGAEFCLKTKGPSFTVNAYDSISKNKAGEKVEVKERARTFADVVLTEARLEQAWDFLRETGVEQGKKGTGAFLKWLA